jgi:hypothetical protein
MVHKVATATAVLTAIQNKKQDANKSCILFVPTIVVATRRDSY